jgi:hypothetical protein
LESRVAVRGRPVVGAVELGVIGSLAVGDSLMDDAVRLDRHGKRAWQRARKVILKALACYDRHGSLPKSAWFSFDKKDNVRALNRLLEEAIGVLEQTRLHEQRQLLEKIEGEVRRKRAEIVRYKSEEIGATEERSWPMVSRKDPQSRVLRAKHDLTKLHTQREQLVEQMVRELQAMGLKLSSEQVQAILLSVSGDDVSCLVSLFFNVKQLTVQLQVLMEEDAQDPIAAKRYYGMYVVLLQILVHAHERFLQRLEHEYLPSLQQLEDENLEQRQNTKRLLRDARDPTEKESLQANLSAQATTDNVVGLYRSFLVHQKSTTIDALEALDRRLEIATNTYRTAEIASNLVTLIRSSARDLNALQSMKLPDLVAFENQEMAIKFQAITARMRQFPRR